MFSVCLCWHPLDTGQGSTSGTNNMNGSAKLQPVPVSVLSFTSLLWLILSFVLFYFLFKKKNKAMIQRPKMTLNSWKAPQRWLFENASPLRVPLPSLRLTFPSPVFFLLRGADSSDTIIQLYCGGSEVAAAPCKGFPRTAWRAEWHRAAMLRVKRAGQQLLTELTLSFLTALVQTVRKV